MLGLLEEIKGLLAGRHRRGPIARAELELGEGEQALREIEEKSRFPLDLDGARDHVSRSVVLLQPDERPGDAERVRMSVRCARGRRGGRERRVPRAVPAGDGLAHGQRRQVHDLVLSRGKQREGPLHLVDGDLRLEAVDTELGCEQ